MRRALLIWTLLAAAPIAARAQPTTDPSPGDGSGSGGSTEPPTSPPTAPPPPPTESKPAGTELTQPPVDPKVPSHPVEPPPPPPPADPNYAPAPRDKDLGFRFGSYGRVVAGSSLRGGKPEKIAVVAHGPRIVEPSYLELELSYLFLKQLDAAGAAPSYVTLRPVITLAFDGTLFHDTGEFDAHPAIRNMYLEAATSANLSAWAGSRMYRGDDIYLFDYWPLDDQNTVGGGLAYHRRLTDDADNSVELAGHVGWNRLNDPFTYQTEEVPNPEQGATTVVQLDRQRTVASFTGGFVHELAGGDAPTKLRAKLHAEYHTLPSGTRKRDDGSFEALPADSGFLVGGELSLFGLADKSSGYRRFVNLFARYAKGLAAFDELAPPTSFGADLKTTHANELSFGASAGWDAAWGNVLFGALSRRFVDADQNSVDFDDGWEYALDVRPLGSLGRGLFLGADVSYQARFPRGLNPTTEKAEDAAVFQVAPMLVYSPLGPSAYDRPQLRLVYRGAHLDEGARDLYVPDDPRHAHEWVHFLGGEAEWWFNSSTHY